MPSHPVFARLRNRITTFIINYFYNSPLSVGLAADDGVRHQRDGLRSLLEPMAWREGDGAAEGTHDGPLRAAALIAPNTKGQPPMTFTNAELDRVGLEILRELAAERLNRGPTAHQHQPCAMCGVGTSPEWRGPTPKRGLGLVCGRCGEWVFDSDSDPRDLAASVLANLSTRTVHRVKPGFGELVGLVFFVETDRTEPNPTPWAHINVAELRTKAQELAAANHLRLPTNYDPAACVVW